MKTILILCAFLAILLSCEATTDTESGDTTNSCDDTTGRTTGGDDTTSSDDTTNGDYTTVADNTTGGDDTTTHDQNNGGSSSNTGVAAAGQDLSVLTYTGANKNGTYGVVKVSAGEGAVAGGSSSQSSN